MAPKGYQKSDDRRQGWGLPLIETFFQDLRYGARKLIKNPAFTIVAVLMLALGIGVNLAMFSIVNAVLLRPLPYKAPDRLAIFWNYYGTQGQKLPRVSVPDYFDYRKQVTTFEELGAAYESPAMLTGSGEPEQIDRNLVTSSFFSLLGVNMYLGRNFLPEEDTFKTADKAVAIISYRLWQRRFGGDPKVLEQTIKINDFPYNIVGVLPANFKWYTPPDVRLKDADLWAPSWLRPVDADRTNNSQTVLGRLKPGISLQQAQAEMDAVAGRLRAQYPEHKNSDIRIGVVPLQQDLVRRARPTILVPFAAVCFILLIACANLANLLLIRAVGREKEVAIRFSLGASRLRIIRQTLTEGLLLSILGGMVGLLLASWALKLLIRFQPGNLPRMETVAIDRRVLAVGIALCFLTPILFGLAPALQAARANLADVLKQGGRGHSAAGGRALRSMLVVVEIALSLILLIGAGLLIRTFVSMQRIHLGYDPENVLTFRLLLPFSKYGFWPAAPKKSPGVFAQLDRQISAIPGVEAVGETAQLPLTQGGFQAGYAWDDESAKRLETYSAERRFVNPDYFKAMGTRLLAGRFYTENDNADSPSVIIVDDRMARKLWPNENPIGQRLMEESVPRRWSQVIGVVEHMLNKELGPDTREQIYLTQRQAFAINTMSFTVRTRPNAGNLMPLIEKEIHSLDPDLAVYGVRPMKDYVSDAMAETRYSLFLISGLGAAAIILAAVGLYGVISYSVNQRSHEIGIRMALGGQSSDILKLILGEGLILTLIGVVTGLIGAAVLTRWMSSLLFGVSATDKVTFAGVTALLVIIVFVASYVPARQATKVDPVLALRYE